MSIENALNLHLRNNIKKWLDKKNISVRDFERRSGLKHSIVQNILHGRSQNPTIKVVQSIARELDCTIEELIDTSDPIEFESLRGPELDKSLMGNVEKVLWNKDLFMDTVSAVHEAFERKKSTPTKDEIMYCIEQVYSYSLGGNTDSADKKFASWIVEIFLKNSTNKLYGQKFNASTTSDED